MEHPLDLPIDHLANGRSSAPKLTYTLKELALLDDKDRDYTLRGAKKAKKGEKGLCLTFGKKWDNVVIFLHRYA